MDLPEDKQTSEFGPTPSSRIRDPPTMKNGHEWDIKTRNDLQYACAFELPTPRDCATNDSSCDCAEADGLNNPLCQTDTGAYGKLQHRAKAYPGRRQLAVLHGLDPNQAIAASICPSTTLKPQADDFGYRPVVKTIVDRLKSVISGTCWAQARAPTGDGSVGCVVLEASKLPEGTTACGNCASMGARVTPDPAAVAKLQKNDDFIANQLQCVCEIPQVSPGAQLTACIESTDDLVMVGGTQVDGWCYVDPSQHAGANAQLVQSCPDDAKRTIRFVGRGDPMPGSLTFLQCKP